MLTTVRDFVLLGALLGFGGPLGPMVGLSFGPLGGEIGFVVCSFGFLLGGLLGLPVGVVLEGLRRRMMRHPLAISWVGFPVGAFAGGLVGLVLYGILTPVGDAIVLIIPPAVVFGGMTVGVFWLPYLAVRHRERSGLPLVIAAGLAAVPIGLFVLLTVMIITDF